MNTPCLKPIIEPVDFVNSMNFLKKNADSSELFTPVHVFPLNFLSGLFCKQRLEFLIKTRQRKSLLKIANGMENSFGVGTRARTSAWSPEQSYFSM